MGLKYYGGYEDWNTRVEGSVERVSEAESSEYFHSRPVSSQIGAWVSDQSKARKDTLYLNVITRAGEQEPGVFGSKEPEPLEKNTRSRSPWEKIRSRSRLKKKSGAGAAKKFVDSPALVITSVVDPLQFYLDSDLQIRFVK